MKTYKDHVIHSPRILVHATAEKEHKYPCHWCKKPICAGDEYRYTPDKRIYYCANCVAFFASRWSYTFLIFDLSPKEQELKAGYDRILLTTESTLDSEVIHTPTAQNVPQKDHIKYE